VSKPGDDRDGRPGLLLQLAGGLAVQQLAGSGADRRADRGRGQQRRGKQPDGEPDRAQAGCALADHVVGLLHRQGALEVLADDHRAVQVATAGQDRLVVLLGGVLRHVAADQDIDRLVIECHLDSSSNYARCSCREPVPGVPVLCDRVQRLLVLG
jgi:hypothetical protein